MYLLNQIGEWNPQLLRELKGRLKSRNLWLIAGISLLGQLFIYLYYRSLLPTSEESWSRYCQDYHCFPDLLGNFVIMEKLWWLDIFVAMSVAGIGILLVGGSYLLIADLANEEKQGTLNFIRLSPTSVENIMIGKALGVPSLLYILGLITAPLHIISGLKAGIPLGLIAIYYLVLAASLICFYSLSILYALVTTSLGGFQPWLASGAILFTMFMLAGIVSSQYFDPTYMVFDWLLIFYPGTILHYLVHSTYIAPDAIEYLDLENFSQILWYGNPIFTKVSTATILIVSNYLLWSYWAWQGIKRRFHNPLATVISKKQSYRLTFSFIVMALGFTLQNLGESWQMTEDGFIALQLVNLVFGLIIAAILTPSRQILHDWARYRHQESAINRNILSELLLGEKSPGILALAANLGIITLYILPSIFSLTRGGLRLPIFWGWLMTINLVLICGLIIQIMLQMKNKRRFLWATGAIAFITITPLVIFACFSIDPIDQPLMWLFSIVPTLVTTEVALGSYIFLGLCVQWLAIAVIGGGFTYNLRKAGESETKKLLSN